MLSYFASVSFSCISELRSSKDVSKQSKGATVTDLKPLETFRSNEDKKKVVLILSGDSNPSRFT